MYARWGAAALLTIAAAMPVHEAAAQQDAIGGAILGGAATTGAGAGAASAQYSGATAT